MIQLNIGVPGSGKSYYVVKQIVDIANSKSLKYQKIITNINGLKYDDLNKINPNIKFEVLHYDDLLEEMEKEYHFHLDNKRLENYDDEVKRIGILSKYYDSLIVIDECHTLIDDNDIVKRFVTYHRHWNIDLILITQAKSDLPKILLKNVEFMIIAQNGKKRLLPFLFRYFHYSSTSEYASNLYSRESVFLKQKYSKYYSSGATVLSSTVFLKFLVPILLLFFVFSYQISNFKFSSKKDNNISIDTNSTIKSTAVNSNSIKSTAVNSNSLLKITCYKNNCLIKDNDFVFSLNVLEDLLLKNDCKMIFIQKALNKTDFVASCQNQQIFKVLEQLNNEKKSLPNQTFINSSLHSFNTDAK